jgi:hypothetical protein
MQPHQPFVGYPELADDHQRTREEPDTGEEGPNSVWRRVRDGTHALAELRAAYVDNLRTVLHSIETLVDNCDADIVLTADHGNAFGSLGLWGHPDGSLHPSVRRVPWVRVEGRDLETHNPDVDWDVGHSDAAEDEVRSDMERRLAQLGYLDDADN